MKCVTCGYDDNGTGDSAHMCSTKPFRPRDCKHGQLARSCEICGLEAEVERLTECLKNANNNHEEFERKWYLAIDEQDELKDENAQLKAELAVRWLPIESAPGDEIVLVAGEFDGTGDWRIKCGYKDAENEHWKIFGASWKPTHWMPLPVAPGAAP